MLKMRQILIAGLFAVVFATGVFAQAGECSALPECKYFYVFGAARTASTVNGPRVVKGSNGGIGYETVGDRGFGAGLEIGGGFPENLDGIGGIYGSLSALYHRWPSARLTVFGVAGVTGMTDTSGDDRGNAGFHFGGGGDYWFADKAAFRFEYRAQTFKHCGGCVVNTFRVGFSFPFR
ncbi:MAG TPA: hypothetical protein VFY29_17555 [Terriglobia bacterium]|nr:hypothetical protein [Terriglobia bacterium]